MIKKIYFLLVIHCICFGGSSYREISDKNGIFIKIIPLIEAVKSNDIRKVRKVLKTNRVNINKKDEDGNTALFYATSKGNLEIVELLLENGADSLSKNNNGKTPLDNAQMQLDIKSFEPIDPTDKSKQILIKLKYPSLTKKKRLGPKLPKGKIKTHAIGSD